MRAVIFVAAALVAGISCASEPPRLVLQITVDQLRGDMLAKYRHRFGAGGFRRLMEEGTWYTNAYYGTSNTFTASGHAVLVTGADTAEHGMVGNEWFDRASGKVMYCTADATFGQSPANLTSTTVADELIAASDARSKVFAIAGKDRSAIIPAGHRGNAFWFVEKDGAFATSAYYYDTPPAWVTAWNARNESKQYSAADWRKSLPSTQDSAPGSSFTRPKTTLSYTPFLDTLTASFARDLVKAEKLGQGVTIDYLAISFSATDYVGHAYGPGSPEAEANLVTLDATLAALFRFLDDTIGKDHVLIVLSADHGVDDIPEERHELGFDADRFYPQKLLEQVNATLRARFHLAEDPLVAFVPPGFYLRQPNRELEVALAEELTKVPGVAYAFTRTDLLAGRVPPTEIGRKVARGFHPTRSGDVVIAQKQFWYLYSDPECCAAMHGSPYSYDTHVPVIFVGAGIAPRIVARNVEPASIAPTLAALLGINPPSGNSAPVLPEILERRR